MREASGCRVECRGGASLAPWGKGAAAEAALAAAGSVHRKMSEALRRATRVEGRTAETRERVLDVHKGLGLLQRRSVTPREACAEASTRPAVAQSRGTRAGRGTSQQTVQVGA